MAINSRTSSTTIPETAALCQPPADAADVLQDGGPEVVTSQQQIDSNDVIPVHHQRQDDNSNNVTTVVPSEVKRVTAKYRWYRALETRSTFVYLILSNDQVLFRRELYNSKIVLCARVG